MIGTGAIGTAVATALMRHGHSVRVWNRTRTATEPLVQQGAVSASTAAAAVAGSDLALVCLTDFTAVSEVLASISADEHATDAPRGRAIARSRAARSA